MSESVRISFTELETAPPTWRAYFPSYTDDDVVVVNDTQVLVQGTPGNMTMSVHVGWWRPQGPLESGDPDAQPKLLVRYKSSATDDPGVLIVALPYPLVLTENIPDKSVSGLKLPDGTPQWAALAVIGRRASDWAAQIYVGLKAQQK